MAVETVELLVDIELLRNQCEFYLEAGRVGIDVEPLYSIPLPGMSRLEDLG